MYKQCQTDRTRQRQEMIARTLLDLLENRSFSSVTVTELCQRARIPRKAFYRYFDSKEDILHYAIDQVVWKYMQLADEFEDELVNLAFCVEIFRFWEETPRLLRVLTRQESMGMFVDTMTRSILSTRQALEMDRRRPHQELFILFSTAGFCNLLVYWCHNGFQETPEELGATFYRFMTAPLS